VNDVPNHHPDSDARERRLAEIRARRGSPERLARIEELQAAKVASKKNTTSDGRKTPGNSSEMFGHSWPFWFRMRDAGYEYICECARKRTMTTYKGVWEAVAARVGEDVGNHWRQLPQLLGHISEHTYPTIGFIATALVIYEEGDEHPGPGFFRLAASMGVLARKDSPPTREEWVGMTDAQRGFWETHVNGMFAQFSEYEGG
jgi:hypothetical protein